MYNTGNLTMSDCTLSGNTAGDGGGVNNAGTANLTDCTVSGNSRRRGGGLNAAGATYPDRHDRRRQQQRHQQ